MSDMSADGVPGLVSVIVPTHRRAPLLREALRSILAQRHPQIEIIIIANGCGGDDDTEQVVREFESGERAPLPPAAVSFIDVAETLGGARARNLGLDAARGEYIAFLDDDDRWHPDKLTTQIELLNRHHCALVGAEFFYLYGDNQRRPAGRAAAADAEFGLAAMACENRLGSFSFCLTRKSHLGASRIDEGLDALQDWDLWLKILTTTGLPARISRARHVDYRLDSERISTHHRRVAAAQQRFLRAWRDALDAPSVDYHQMRTRCEQLKAEAQERGRLSVILPSIGNAARVVKTIYRSGERAHWKRYVHYALLPLVDIDAVRVWWWKRRHTRAAGES